jgi:hypothetical protein
METQSALKCRNGTLELLTMLLHRNNFRSMKNIHLQNSFSWKKLEKSANLSI